MTACVVCRIDRPVEPYFQTGYLAVPCSSCGSPTCPDCHHAKLRHVGSGPLAHDRELGDLIVVIPCEACGCLRYLLGGGEVDRL